ncbi:hypothetical protein TS64_01700 [Aneurinibacillus migulanus]|nr:hypothetical protein TS64_01700 [Aneurinibacillus migulanus]
MIVYTISYILHIRNFIFKAFIFNYNCSVHFKDTSFVLEENDEIVAFLVGFVSQAYRQQAYIHFIGVHPDYWKQNAAKQLYDIVFQKVKQCGCTEVHCVTSPINKGSIAFHTKIGFQIQQGDCEVNGISVMTNYDGRGQDHVLFVKRI